MWSVENERGRGLRGLKLNPALLKYVAGGPPARAARRSGHRRERRVSKRLPAETIERLVAEYAGGATAAELSQRYGLAKNSVIRLVRQAGKQVRHPRLSSSELARLVVLFQAGLTQRETGARAPSGTACAGCDSYDGVVLERLLEPLSVGTV
jgi:hypothetical protein